MTETPCPIRGCAWRWVSREPQTDRPCPDHLDVYIHDTAYEDEVTAGPPSRRRVRSMWQPRGGRE